MATDESTGTHRVSGGGAQPPGWLRGPGLSPASSRVWTLHRRRRLSEQTDTDRQEPCERRIHDYRRHGTTTLVRRAGVAPGQATDAYHPRHRPARCCGQAGWVRCSYVTWRAALGGRPRWSPCACRPRVAVYGQQRGGEPAFRRTSCARPRPGQEPASRYVRVAVGTCGCCAGDDESATPTASTTPSPILIAENRSTGVVRDQTGPGRPDGPRSVRMAPGIHGSRRARAVTPGSMNPQVDARSRL